MTESYDQYANSVAGRINGILKDEFMIERYSRDKTLWSITSKKALINIIG